MKIALRASSCVQFCKNGRNWLMNCSLVALCLTQALPEFGKSPLQAERARRERPRRVRSAEAQPSLLSSDEATRQQRQAALTPEEASGAPEEEVDPTLSDQQPPHRHLKPAAAAVAATEEHMAEPGEDLLEAAENPRHD